MRKHKQKPLRDWLLYAILRVLMVILSIFSIESNLTFARFLGRMLWKYFHKGRQRAIDNLTASFPDKDSQWVEKIGKRSFEQIAMLTVDMLFMPRMVTRSNWRKYSSYTNVEQVKWLMQQGKGLLMVTGHYGNFEIMGYLLGLFGYNIYSISRALDNRYVNDYLYGVRQQAGQKLVEKTGASKVISKIVTDGRTLCFIGDQDAGPKGIFVDYFGRKASTFKSVALCAMNYNVPIGVAFSRRRDNKFFFEIEVNRIIFPEEWQDKDNPMEWITAEFTKAIEEFVRRDPSQYWWIHRRWKHRPKNKKTS